MNVWPPTPVLKGTLLAASRGTLRRVNNLGRQRACPLCGWTGFHFKAIRKNAVYRPEAECPDCHALERHRDAFAILHEEIGVDHRVLHVAPEPMLAPWLRRVARDYLSIDLAPLAMRQMDLTALDLPDACMSLVWCSHVLEHILDDHAAMREMHRVLVPGGRAIIQVPIDGERTREDASLTTDAQRLAAFGQSDHVRMYGTDIESRLRSAGFRVRRRSAEELAPHVIRRHGLDGSDLFDCWKP